jgi:hypothetical protein
MKRSKEGRRLAAYCKDLLTFFHESRLPMPESVTMEQDPAGIPGQALMRCKFKDRTETWKMRLAGDMVLGWVRQ